MTLDSIQETSYGNLECIVIDNGSHPPLRIKPYRFPVTVLRNRANKGFAQANNEALSASIMKKGGCADYYLLCNNDVIVPPAFFKKMIPYLRSDTYAMIAPSVLCDGNTSREQGIGYYADGRAVSMLEDAPAAQTKNKRLLSATCLFLSAGYAREMMKTFHFCFIPAFFAYVEDVELSLRAVLMGKKQLLVGDVVVKHAGSSTLRDDRAILHLSLRNQLWTVITTWTGPMIRRYLGKILMGQFINVLVYSLKYGPFFMLKIYGETFFRLAKLVGYRSILQPALVSPYPAGLIRTDVLSLGDHITGSRTFKRIRNFGKQSS